MENIGGKQTICQKCSSLHLLVTDLVSADTLCGKCQNVSEKVVKKKSKDRSLQHVKNML